MKRCQTIIIYDILDFSKIEAGKLDMESTDFNLDDVLENLANLVTVKAREKADLEVSFEVFLAASGEDGLEEIERADKDKPFGLVIMDWKMPGMDGIEASARKEDHRKQRRHDDISTA